MLLVPLVPPENVNPDDHVAYAASISVCDVHDGNDTANGQLITIGSATATSKVDVQLVTPQSSVTMYVNERFAPAQTTLAGSSGISSMLSSALQPPENVKPDTQVLYAAWIVPNGKLFGNTTGAGHVITTGTAGATSNVDVQLVVPQSSVTVYVNVRSAPWQCSSPVSVGIVPMFVVALHPPV
jgi:hypothetical protein